MKRVRPFNSVSRTLENVTRCLFSYRKKLVSKAVKRCFPEHVDRVSKVLGPWLERRVYELPIEVFVEIARIVASN